MGLKEKLEQDLKTALKSGQATRTKTLRLLASQIKNQEIDNKTRERSNILTETELVAVLKREAKKRKEAIELYAAGGRADLRTAEEEELVIIKSYLPPEMDEAEVRTIVEKVIEASPEIVSPGPLVGKAMKELAGRAEAGVVQKIIAEILAKRTQ